MAQRIEVSPALLRNTGAELQERASKIQNLLGMVDKEVRSLPSEVFDGIAAGAFRAEYRQLANQLWKMTEIFYTFSDDLERVAQEFEQADRNLAGQEDGVSSRGTPSEKQTSTPPASESSAPPPKSSTPVQDIKGHAKSYAKQIDSFNVETNPRYQRNRQGKGETYCNIFAADVARSLGAEIPEWLDWNHDGTIDDYLNANEMVKWLEGSYDGHGAATGPAVGWKQVDASTAATMANQGQVVVAGWHNAGGIGHMAVVRPGSSESGDLSQILIAQAGAHNANNESLTDGFGPGRRIQFFVYDKS